MTPDPIATAARRAKRINRLHGATACLACGITDAHVLTPTPGGDVPQLLEEHHLLGRKNDADFVVALCQNCHALHHEGLRQVGVDVGRRHDNPLDAVIAFMQSIGTLLRLLVDRWHDMIDRLSQLRDSLDREHAGWREAAVSG